VNELCCRLHDKQILMLTKIVQRHHLPRPSEESFAPEMGDAGSGRQKKTLLIRQKSFEYALILVCNIVKPGSDLSVPIFHRDGVGTLHSLAMQMMQVVKASSGHFPQPFLIRDVVRTGANIVSSFSYFQILTEIFGKSHCRQYLLPPCNRGFPELTNR
jgi:hypothetical protein